MSPENHPLYWDFMDAEIAPPDELVEENDGVWRYAIEQADAGDNSKLIGLINLGVRLTGRGRRWLVDLLERNRFEKTKEGAQKTPAYSFTEAQLRIRFWRWLVDRYVSEGRADSDYVAVGIVADEFGVTDKVVQNAISRVAKKKRGRPKKAAPEAL